MCSSSTKTIIPYELQRMGGLIAIGILGYDCMKKFRDENSGYESRTFDMECGREMRKLFEKMEDSGYSHLEKVMRMFRELKGENSSYFDLLTLDTDLHGLHNGPVEKFKSSLRKIMGCGSEDYISGPQDLNAPERANADKLGEVFQQTVIPVNEVPPELEAGLCDTALRVDVLRQGLSDAFGTALAKDFLKDWRKGTTGTIDPATVETLVKGLNKFAKYEKSGEPNLRVVLGALDARMPGRIRARLSGSKTYNRYTEDCLRQGGSLSGGLLSLDSRSS